MNNPKRKTTVKGFAAYVGVWFTVCLIGEQVFKVQGFAPVIIWIFGACVIARLAEIWINQEPARGRGERRE